MQVFYLTIFVVFICIFYAYVFRGTVFEVSLIKGSYPGFFFFYGFLVFIAPAIIVLNLYPIENFWVAFKVEQDDVYWISLLILISYLVMLLVLSLIVKSSRRNFGFNYPTLRKDRAVIYRKFVFRSVVICLVSICLLWFFGDVKHALFYSLMHGESTSIIRSALRNERETRYLGHFFMMLVPLVVPIIASPVFNGKRLQRYFLFVSVLAISSFAGNKGPTATAVLMYGVSFATFNRVKISFSMVVKLLFLLSVLMILVYYLVGIQYSHIESVSDFWLYFSQRVFVAQLIGAYEQFSLNIRNFDYVFHSVPFLSFFMDYPIFSKDLLLISEDRIDPFSIGVKNSFFIAESYAIGGWYFILPSIIIFAVNYMISYLIVLFLLNRCLGYNLEFNKFVTAMFIFSYFSVTGSFSDMFLFKLVIMSSLFLLPILLVGWIGSKNIVLYRQENKTRLDGKSKFDGENTRRLQYLTK